MGVYIITFSGDIGPILAAYFIGSIPFGLLIARILGKGDLRSQGSGNIGATNALRVGGKVAGLLTLVLDTLKGVLAIGLVYWMATGTPETLMLYLAAFFAVLGHVFPVWLKFRGGKGVATTLAVIVVLSWPVGLATIASWIAVFLLTRISSLSAIVAMALMPLWGWVWTSETEAPRFMALCVALSSLVIVRHASNIRRLWHHEEKKM